MDQKIDADEIKRLWESLREAHKKIDLSWNLWVGCDAEGRIFHDRLCEIEKKLEIK